MWLQSHVADQWSEVRCAAASSLRILAACSSLQLDAMVQSFVAREHRKGVQQPYAVPSQLQREDFGATIRLGDRLSHSGGSLSPAFQALPTVSGYIYHVLRHL